MNFRIQNTGTVSLLAGLLVGCWIGLKILPTLSFFRPVTPPAEESTVAQAVRANLEGKLAETLRLSPNIVDARVHLAKGTASVTLKTGDAELRSEQIEAIAQQIAASVDGLKAGRVFIFNADGMQLNRQSVEDYDHRQLWIDLAITVGKVLGILAALVTLRYLIQTIGAAAKRAESIKAT